VAKLTALLRPRPRFKSGLEHQRATLVCTRSSVDRAADF
jgi:hypothetical protein